MLLQKTEELGFQLRKEDKENKQEVYKYTAYWKD